VELSRPSAIHDFRERQEMAQHRGRREHGETHALADAEPH
jgi:hypothetical protein